MNDNKQKIVVAGAGIVGTVQALLLAQVGYRVTLVDAASLPAPSSGLDVRSVALSYRSCQLLAGCGLWPVGGGCAINEVHVTERGKFGAVRLLARDLEVPQLGAVIQNAVLEQHLTALVNDCPDIELHQPASAKVVSNTSQGVSVQIQNSHEKYQMDAALLIAADGTFSKIRNDINIKTRTFDYQQHAVVANLQCQRDHQNIAYERFTSSGPLALLPLGKRQMAMVYTVSSADINTFKTCSDEEFLELLQQSFGGKLGRFEALGKRGVFPLERVESQQQTNQQVILIGNAARTLHPVAGQGLNLALRDVVELSALLGKTDDLTTVAAEFVRARASDQQSVVRMTDLLARVFRQQPWPVAIPVSMARSTALAVLDLVPLLRKRFGAASSGIGKPLANFSESQTGS